MGQERMSAAKAGVLAFMLVFSTISVAFTGISSARVDEENVFSKLPISAYLKSTTIHVDDENTVGPWDGSEQHPYANITSALANAQNGNAIFVHNGTYHENLYVDKNVSLTGENRDTTVIEGYYTYLGNVLRVVADAVSISGFTIQDNWCGIAILSTGGCLVTANRITNCKYQGGGGEIYKTGRGIMLSDSINVIVTGNLADGNDRDVSIENAEDSTIEENTIVNAASWGVVSEGSRRITIRNNIIENNSYEGIYLAGSYNNTIVGNTVVHNGDEGIYLGASENNTILGNTVSQNPGEGIWIDWSSGNCVIGNNLTNNGKRGIFVWYSNKTLVYHNRIFDNSWEQGFSNSINTWDNGYPSGGNFWGNYNGTDSSRGIYQNETGSDGIGDTPYLIAENNLDKYPLMIFRGDINGDYSIDIYDAILLANAFGSDSGSPRWNKRADINNDGAVDIYDALILAVNFGRTI